MISAASSDAIGITAIGMVSSLGRDAITSCAAARAGLSAASELKVLNFGLDELFGRETLDGPPTVFGHQIRGIADGFTGFGKAMLLGSAALTDLLKRRPLSERELARTGICISLSEHSILDADRSAPEDVKDRDHPGSPLPSAVWKQHTARLIPKLADHARVSFADALQTVHYEGHAGIGISLVNALTAMSRGQVDRCIIGGIDSRIDAGFLGAAARLGLLRTNQNPVGLMPGEAAAFFLLERLPDAARLGVTVNTLVTSCAHARDPSSLFSRESAPRTEMARTIQTALAREPSDAGPLDLTILDLNGTEQRALEWSQTLIAFRARTDISGAPAWLPAASFGDTGAASGAIGVCIAARSFERGYAPGRSTLVCTSSEGGGKAAVLLRMATR